MAAAALNLYVEGIGFWASGLPGWAASLPTLRGEAGLPDDASAKPAPALLAPTERRRAPDSVALALEVALAACAMAGRDPRSLPSVFSSTHGDPIITDYVCQTLAQTPLALSPTRFHNSVHNAAAGYWSIGTGAMTATTAISAHAYSFGAGLLEAAAQVACEHAPVLLVAYDIASRGALTEVAPASALFGVALVLAPLASAATRAQLVLHTSAQAAAATAPANPALHPLYRANPMAHCLTLLEALALAAPCTLRLAAAPQLALNMEVRPWP